MLYSQLLRTETAALHRRSRPLCTHPPITNPRRSPPPSRPPASLHGQDAAVTATRGSAAGVAQQHGLGAASDIGTVLLPDQRGEQLREGRRQDRAHPLGAVDALQRRQTVVRRGGNGRRCPVTSDQLVRTVQRAAACDMALDVKYLGVLGRSLGRSRCPATG